MKRIWKPEAAEALRIERGRTRDWLARFCGINKRSLGNILRGDKPSLSVALLMAQALECDIADIMPVDPIEAESLTKGA